MAERERPRSSVQRPSPYSHETSLPKQYTPESLLQYLPAVPDAPLPEIIQNNSETKNEILPSVFASVASFEDDPTFQDIETPPQYMDSIKQEDTKPKYAESNLQPISLPHIEELLAKVEPITKQTEMIYPSLASSSSEAQKPLVEPKPSSEYPKIEALLQTASLARSYLIPRSQIASEEPQKAISFDISPDINHPLFHLLSQYLLAEKEFQIRNNQLLESLNRQNSLINACWTVKEAEVLISGGNCRCGRKLPEKSATVIDAKFSPDALSEVNEECAHTASIFTTELMISRYYREKFRCEVDIFIDEYISSCLFLGTLSTHSMVVVVPEQNYQEATRREILSILEFLKILFHFITEASVEDRRSAMPFFEHVQRLIINLGALVLRCGTSLDHCWLVYVLIQSPGIHTWGTSLLQFPSYWDDTSSSGNHFLAMLSVVLEHGENPSLQNVASLLQQFPFLEFFDFIFKSPDNSAETILRTFMGMAKITTPALRKYQESHEICITLTKVMLQAVKGINLFLSVSKTENREFHASLLLQFEELQLQFISTIAGHSDKAMQQYLAGLPFEMMDDRICWRIFFVLYHVPEQLQEKLLQNHLPTQELWESTVDHFLMIRDDVMKTLAENRLLLHTFHALALSCGKELAVVICSEIFFASIVSPIARSECYKIGREAIPSICKRFPVCIPKLLFIINTNLDEMNQATLKLAEEIPWNLFHPSPADLDIIESLFTSSLPGQSISYFLGAIIIERLPWGFDLHPNATWNTKNEFPSLPVTTIHRILFLLGKTYIRSREHRAGIIKTLMGEDHHPSLKKFCWRVFLKASLFDSLGSPLVPSFTQTSEEIIWLRSFLAQNTGQRTSIPLFIMLLCSDVGHNLETFCRVGVSQLELFENHKHFHYLLARLLHDLLPNLLDQLITQENDNELGNEAIIPAHLIVRLTKPDSLGPNVMGLLACKMILQCVTQPVLPHLIHFWLHWIPQGSQMKSNSFKSFMNLVFMAGTFSKCFSILQDFLLNSVKGNKQGIFDFFSSFSFNEKIKFPWLSLHFLFLESMKQRKAWKEIITCVAEASVHGDKQIQILLKQKKKSLNLQQFSIIQLARFCCEWDFTKIIQSSKNINNDPWTAILLHWQLLISLSTQTIHQDIIPLTASYGNLFLKAIRSEFDSSAQLASLNRNITIMSSWLHPEGENIKPRSEKLRMIVQKLHDSFVEIQTWFSPSYVVLECNSLLKQSIETPGLFENSNGTTLLIHHIQSADSLYKQIILLINDFVPLPSYQTQMDNQQQTKTHEYNNFHVSEDRQTLPAPPLIISLPAASALPICNEMPSIRLNILLQQTEKFVSIMNHWNHLDSSQNQLIPRRFVSEPFPPQIFRCRDNSCGYNNRVQPVNIPNNIEDTSTWEKVINGREQLRKVILDDLITTEFTLSILEIQFTLYNLEKFIKQNEPNSSQVNRNAESFFILFLRSVNEKTANFAPCRLLLLDCLNRLEFILYKSQSLMYIYQTLLENPIRARLCREKFYPMLNMDLFAPMYELVVSKIPCYDVETIDYLRSCLDEHDWLLSLSLHEYSSENDPSFQEVIRMIDISLSTCDKQEKSFMAFTEHLFPLFFLPALRSLISAINNRRAIPETLNQFVCLIEKNITKISPMKSWTASLFMREFLWGIRQHETLFHNHWSVFASCFVRLSRCLIQSLFSNNVNDINQAIAHVENLFLPWIGNFSSDAQQNDVQGLAWLESDKMSAIPFFKEYVYAMKHILSIFPEQQSKTMKEFWKFFISYLAASSLPCHWEIINELLLDPTIPWHKFTEWESFAYQMAHQLLKFHFQLPAPTSCFFERLLNIWVTCFEEHPAMVAQGWKTFCIPVAALFASFSLPISVERMKVIRKFLMNVSWDKFIFEDYGKLLRGHVVNEIFLSLFLGPQSKGNSQSLNSDIDILIDHKIVSIEDQFTFFLGYLRQNCFCKNFLNSACSYDAFAMYYEQFEHYVSFIIYWIERASELKTISLGNILSNFLFSLAAEFAERIPLVIKYFGEQRVYPVLSMFMKVLQLSAWIQTAQPLLSLFLERQPSCAPHLLYVCSKSSPTSPWLPPFCEMICSKFFRQVEDWPRIFSNFCFPDEFPHHDFQLNCAKQGFGLASYCYFRRLHQCYSDQTNEMEQMIHDLWKVIQNFVSQHNNHEKLLLLYYFLVELIRSHIVLVQSMKGKISKIVAGIIEKAKILSEDKFGGVLGIGGTPSTVPIACRFGYKILFVFLSIQFNIKNGGLLRAPVRDTRDLVNQIVALLKKRDYSGIHRMVHPMAKFLGDCQGQQLSPINQLQKILSEELFQKLGCFYWHSSLE